MRQPGDAPRIAFYAGSFDPVTLGHMDVVAQAAALCDALVVGVGIQSGKTALFSGEERVALLEAAIAGVAWPGGTPAPAVLAFEGLAVHAAARAGATLLVRGLRDGSDLDVEMQMAHMNAVLRPGLLTVFLPASADKRHIAATFVRQIAGLRGDVSAFVPAPVVRALGERFGGPQQLPPSEPT